MSRKEAGLSLIKDQMLENLAMISDRCKNLIWEVENYIKDKNGNIPKKADHLIDCWRYGNAAAGLSLDSEDLPEAPDPDTVHRFTTPHIDLELQRQLDPDYLVDSYGD